MKRKTYYRSIAMGVEALRAIFEHDETEVLSNIGRADLTTFLLCTINDHVWGLLRHINMAKEEESDGEV